MRTGSRKPPRAVVLGPQRHVPIVRSAVESLVGKRRSAPVAFVSAGWEEREAEDGEFRDHLGQPVLNLEIWSRVERIFARDPELLAAMRARHDALRRLQEVYRLRLHGLVQPALLLVRRAAEHGAAEQDVADEAAAAVAMVRQLDAEHCRRVAELHAEFDARVRPGERAAVVQHRREIAGQLEAAAVLCIAGGHVGVLLHRLQLFDVLGLWGDRPLIAWSAGAMALAEQVVLFHHARDLGHDVCDTEVMERGLGALPGIVPLPHSRKRLPLQDQDSLRLLSLRFAGSVCALLDDGDRFDFDGQRWTAHPGGRTLAESGRVHQEQKA